MSEPRTTTRLPLRTRTYRNHHYDSTRWDTYAPRDGDIVITTAYKAGTTWMQAIVANLIFQREPLPAHLHDLSPWLDMRLLPLEEVLRSIEVQTNRRFLKTHLALDGIPYYPEVRYVVVARDGRDVFMSADNHFRNYTQEFRELINNTPGRVGAPLPPMEQDIHKAWRDWLTRGWFEWEQDGYPFGSFFGHVRSWWEYRHLPNLHLVHYNDLLDDLEGEIHRVAAFLEIDVAEDFVPELVDRVTFTTMKRDAEQYAPALAGRVWTQGAHTFIHKGTNGRWREVLSQEDLALYDEVVAARLEPDCARWLARGRAALR